VNRSSDGSVAIASARFKWMHPRFRGKSVDDVTAAALDLADTRTVVAWDEGFDTWADLVAFAEAVDRDRSVARFVLGQRGRGQHQ
jgi:hypothetical protein